MMHRQKYLQFAAAYLSQARLDIANGRPELAQFCIEQRRAYQLKLADLRAARNH